MSKIGELFLDVTGTSADDIVNDPARIRKMAASNEWLSALDAAAAAAAAARRSPEQIAAAKARADEQSELARIVDAERVARARARVSAMIDLAENRPAKATAYLAVALAVIAEEPRVVARPLNTDAIADAITSATAKEKDASNIH